LDGRTDGRLRQAQTTSDELRAGIDGSSGNGGVAYEARGYKQDWADERAARRARKPTAQIEPKLRDFGSFYIIVS